MEESNTPATISLVAGIIVIIAHFAWCCLGIIPFVGLIIQVVVWVGDLVAVGAGIMGLSQAKTSGVGKGPAIAGLTIGILSILLQVLFIGSMLVLGGLALVLSVLAG